jgi:hypothetical protein
MWGWLALIIWALAACWGVWEIIGQLAFRRQAKELVAEAEAALKSSAA